MNHTHAEAMEIIRNAYSVTTLSYEEVIAIYLRSRGILNDDADLLGAPIPCDWKPLLERVRKDSTEKGK